MTYLYFDSSALVKRYARETGTEFVERICQKENITIAISDVTIAELGATFARKLRERNMTENEYKLMLDIFLDDYSNRYFKVAVNFNVLLRAVYLAKKNSLRAYDAIQLACAVNVRETIKLSESKSDIFFVVADDALEKAANAEGFKTINPNTYEE